MVLGVDGKCEMVRSDAVPSFGTVLWEFPVITNVDVELRSPISVANPCPGAVLRESSVVLDMRAKLLVCSVTSVSLVCLLSVDAATSVEFVLLGKVVEPFVPDSRLLFSLRPETSGTTEKSWRTSNRIHATSISRGEGSGCESLPPQEAQEVRALSKRSSYKDPRDLFLREEWCLALGGDDCVVGGGTVTGSWPKDSLSTFLPSNSRCVDCPKQRSTEVENHWVGGARQTEQTEG